MQIYTQFPNYARKNMNFLSQQVNRSTSQRVLGVLKGLFRVCLGLLGSVFGSVKKFTPI